MENIFLDIAGKSLSLDDCHAFMEDDKYGGNVIFVGRVRNHSQGKEVSHLEFEAYIPMALKEMRKIATKITDEFPECKIYCSHRVGKLEIGEVAVLIGIATKHRIKAFEYCAYFIDTLKETVPIWKKEYWEDGSHWVNARP